MKLKQAKTKYTTIMRFLERVHTLLHAWQIVCFHLKWRDFAAQYLLHLPRGVRKFNLWNLSWLIGVLIARLTFVMKGDEFEYGTLDDKVWKQGALPAPCPPAPAATARITRAAPLLPRRRRGRRHHS